MKVLGVIPARGGSKGVIDKNITLVDGQPLISYTINSARESTLLTRAVVTTDSPRIAEISQSFEGTVIMRPAELAQDDTPIIPVIKHALEVSQEQYGEHYDMVVLLQPTSPIRHGTDIDNALNILIEHADCDAVISVVPMQDIHPARMYHVDNDMKMQALNPQLEATRRQDIEPVYYRNGAIYAIRTEVLLEKNSLMVSKKRAYIMPLERLVNIDDERDMHIANVLVKLWKDGRI